MSVHVAAVLEQPVLVLNKNWTPIKVGTVLDAIVEVFSGNAKVLDQDFQTHTYDSWASVAAAADQPCIRTSTLYLCVPEVVILTNYGDVPSRHVAFSRLNIFKRDRYTCQYCGSRPGSDQLTIDHIRPRSRGGTSSWTNCVLACLPCNRRKADKTLEQAGLKVRHPPTKPVWSPKMILAKFERIPVSWQRFVNDAYWNTPLEK